MSSVLIRKKCNLWMFLAISLFGLHIYRNVQTINNIPNDFDLVVSTKATNLTLSNKEEGPKIQPTSCDPQNFIVLIKAGAKSKYQQRREVWRNSTCPSSYKQHGVNYHFMLAMPAHEIIDPNGHNQGKRASIEEIKDMSILRNESRLHHDMVFLSIKEHDRRIIHFRDATMKSRRQSRKSTDHEIPAYKQISTMFDHCSSLMIAMLVSVFCTNSTRA